MVRKEVGRRAGEESEADEPGRSSGEISDGSARSADEKGKLTTQSTLATSAVSQRSVV